MKPPNGTVLTFEQKRQNQFKACILLEVLNGSSINEAYEKRSETAESIGMDYTEFDFWYHHFYNGNHDLDYKKDIKPKSGKFTDLPIDILAKLLGEIRLVDKLSLRKVSHNFQFIVDTQTIKCQELCFLFYDDNATLYFNNELTKMFKPVDGGCKAEFNGEIQFTRGGNYVKMALNEMLLVLKLSGLQLEHLTVGFYMSSQSETRKHLSKKYLNFIESALKTLNHQIHVESIRFTFDRPESVFSMFPYLKAGTLKSIELSSNANGSYQSMIDKLMEFDQWNHAIKTHVRFIFETMSKEELIKLKDIFLKSPEITYWDFASKAMFDFAAIESVFGDLRVPHSDTLRLPDSDKVYRMQFKDWRISIDKEDFPRPNKLVQ